MHAISSYRGNRPTHKHRPPARCKQTGPITIHCVAKLIAQCNKRTEWVILTVYKVFYCKSAKSVHLFVLSVVHAYTFWHGATNLAQKPNTEIGQFLPGRPRARPNHVVDGQRSVATFLASQLKAGYRWWIDLQATYRPVIPKVDKICWHFFTNYDINYHLGAYATYIIHSFIRIFCMELKFTYHSYLDKLTRLNKIF